MKKSFISTSRRIFLVKFTTSTEKFIVQDRELFDLIKEINEPIEFIRASEFYEIKFKRFAKLSILNQFSWDTEVIEYFKTLSYFNNVKF